MYPTESTVVNFNISNKNSNTVWPSFLGQALAVVPIVGVQGATLSFAYNLAQNLSPMSPYSRGTPQSKSPINTTLVSEPFRSFGDMAVLDLVAMLTSNTSCYTSQICEQEKSIAVRILRELSQQFFHGDGLGENLEGIYSRADTTIVSTSAFNINQLYQLKYSVKPASGEGLGWGANAWFSNSEAFRKLLSNLRGNVAQVKWKYHPVMKVNVPHFLEMPWFIDNSILTTLGRSTIFALSLDFVQILYAFSKEYPPNEKGIFKVPIPAQGTIAEGGGFVSLIAAIQNVPYAIAKLINVRV